MKAPTAYNTVFTLRIGYADPWSARGFSEKRNRADNPANLSPSGPGATRLKVLGFVNTRTLSETAARDIIQTVKGSAFMKEIKLFRRPSNEIIEEITGIIRQLTGEWFTDNVQEDTRKDLQFQDMICLLIDGRIKSFIIFTSWEGMLYITLMGTEPNSRGQGLGSELINEFIVHVRELGFEQVVLLTVPPEVKPVYNQTVSFYQKHQFKITKRFNEIWNTGAIEMRRNLY